MQILFVCSWHVTSQEHVHVLQPSLGGGAQPVYGAQMECSGRHLGGVLRHCGRRQQLAAGWAEAQSQLARKTVLHGRFTRMAAHHVPPPHWTPDTGEGRRMLEWRVTADCLACVVQEQHDEMRQEREAAVARAKVAEGALRDERLRAALAASKWQEQMHK